VTAPDEKPSLHEVVAWAMAEIIAENPVEYRPPKPEPRKKKKKKPQPKKLKVSEREKEPTIESLMMPTDYAGRIHRGRE
jgi:ribosome-binding protein aMBF1 (putative translation factor)